MRQKKFFYNILWGVTFLTYLISFFYFFSPLALAQEEGTWKQANIGEPPFKDWCSFLKFLSDMIKWILIIGLLIGVVVIIFGGISFLTAGGDSAKAGQAGKTIGFAAVGIVIVALAFAFVRVLGSLTGVDFNVECEGQQLLD